MMEDKTDVTPTKSATSDAKTCRSGMCCGDKKSVVLWAMLLVVAAIAVWAYIREVKPSSPATQDGTESTVPSKKVSQKTAERVRERVRELVDGKLLQSGTEFEVGEVTEESGLYKVRITVSGQELSSYITKDMDKFIPELIAVKQLDEMEKIEPPKPAKTTVEAKNDKPVVEVFVMSHCPFGVQIEKGILPVFAALRDKIDARIKFVSYAMHGEAELKEQMRQYCIEQKAPQQHYAYLECFVAGDGKESSAVSCMQKTGINQQVIAQCAQATDAQYKVMAQFNDKSTWVSGSYPPFDIHKADNEKYAVQGSPTLVINGEEIQSGRDSQSLLTAICSGFTTPPAECSQPLSSAQPSAGFGTATATPGEAVNGSC